MSRSFRQWLATNVSVRDHGDCKRTDMVYDNRGQMCWLLSARALVLWLHYGYDLPMHPDVLNYFSTARKFGEITSDEELSSCPMVPAALRNALKTLKCDSDAESANAGSGGMETSSDCMLSAVLITSAAASDNAFDLASGYVAFITSSEERREWAKMLKSNSKNTLLYSDTVRVTASDGETRTTTMSNISALKSTKPVVAHVNFSLDGDFNAFGTSRSQRLWTRDRTDLVVELLLGSRAHLVPTDSMFSSPTHALSLADQLKLIALAVKAMRTERVEPFGGVIRMDSDAHEDAHIVSFLCCKENGTPMVRFCNTWQRSGPCKSAALSSYVFGAAAADGLKWRISGFSIIYRVT